MTNENTNCCFVKLPVSIQNKEIYHFDLINGKGDSCQLSNKLYWLKMFTENMQKYRQYMWWSHIINQLSSNSGQKGFEKEIEMKTKHFFLNKIKLMIVPFIKIVIIIIIIIQEQINIPPFTFRLKWNSVTLILWR